MRSPLKASAWWNYKIPPMLAVAYYALSAAPRPPHFSDVKWHLALYMTAAIGIAGFGHVLTDAFDVNEDRFLGKANLWAPLSAGARAALISVLLAASWLPWLLLSAGPIGLALIALEFLLFYLYAAPPFRLKERGFPGIVVDAMYAHMLPALWTWILFSRLSGARAQVWFPVILAGWALAVGMRHLLQHQVTQFDSDSNAKVETYAVRRGREATLKLIVHRLLPLEITLFAALLAAIGMRMPIVPAGFAVFLAWKAFRMRFVQRESFTAPWSGTGADRSTVIGVLVMSRFYERWLPPLVLVGLSIREPSYIVLLVIHVAVFSRGLVELFRDDLPLAAVSLRSRLGSRTSSDVSRFTA